MREFWLYLLWNGYLNMPAGVIYNRKECIKISWFSHSAIGDLKSGAILWLQNSESIGIDSNELASLQHICELIIIDIDCLVFK